MCGNIRTQCLQAFLIITYLQHLIHHGTKQLFCCTTCGIYILCACCNIAAHMVAVGYILWHVKTEIVNGGMEYFFVLRVFREHDNQGRLVTTKLHNITKITN